MAFDEFNASEQKKINFERISDNISVYNGQISGDYTKKHRDSAKLYHDIIGEFAKNGRDLAVDFGSGCGGWTFPLAAYFKSVIGIDSDSGCIAVCEAIADNTGCQNVKFIEDSSLLPIADESVDMILCINALPCFGYDDAWFHFFLSVSRVLKKDGFVIVNYIRPSFLLERFIFLEAFKQRSQIGQTWGWAFRRHFMWLFQWIKSSTQRNISGKRSLFVTNAKAVTRLFDRCGLEVVHDSSDFYRRFDFRGHPLYNEDSKYFDHYYWFVLRRVADVDGPDR